jgi:FeS assembly SUF system protein
MEEMENKGIGTRDILVPKSPGKSSETAEAASSTSADGAITSDLDRLTEDIIGAIKTVYDPEIPVDIFELGLIYKIDVSDEMVAAIDMTLTAPGCPVAEFMPQWVQDAVSTVEGIREVNVAMVFDPPWDPSRMSEEAKLVLNMY